MHLWIIFLSCVLSAGGAPLVCNQNGNIHSHGEMWVYRCHKYQCMNSTVKIISVGCEVSGQCKAIGDQWTIGCFNYECVQEKNFVYNKLIKGGCRGAGGTCHDVGSTWDESNAMLCIQKQCNRKENVYHSVIIGDGCKGKDEKCHDVGTKWNETRHGLCVEIMCHKENHNYHLKILSGQCLYNGKCVAVGQSIKIANGCKIVSCSHNNGVYTTSITSECQDSSGNCHPIGSTGFSLTIGGKLYKNCSCSGDSSSISYKCSG